jgi:hypothetical protein
MAIYLGKHGADELVLFRSATIPTSESHAHLYTAVIGPFKSKVGASYFARYGRNNPHIRTVDDAERLARADSGMEQAILEERMTKEERSIAMECSAQDQSENSPKLMPVDRIDWQIQIQEKQHAELD